MAATHKKRSSKKTAPARRRGGRRTSGPSFSAMTGWIIVFTVLCVVFLGMAIVSHT